MRGPLKNCENGNANKKIGETGDHVDNNAKTR